MSFDLRFIVVPFVMVVFFRQMQGAVRTFSIVKGKRPAPQIQLFPVASIVILYQAFHAPLDPWLVVLGGLGFIGSMALFEWARAAVQGKFFSYAYSKDQPEFLLRAGPYAYIRNPFYTSYILGYGAAAIMFPGVATLLVLLGMTGFLAAAVRQEERRFATSPLASEYENYKQQTGRFVPRL